MTTYLHPNTLQTTLYVGNLGSEVDIQLIHDAFLPFGEVVDVKLPVDPETSNLRGFAFVEFEQEDEALDAIENMHQSEIMGKVIRVAMAKPVKFREFRDKPLWEDDSYIREYIIGEKGEEDQALVTNKMI